MSCVIRAGFTFCGVWSLKIEQHLLRDARNGGGTYRKDMGAAGGTCVSLCKTQEASKAQRALRIKDAECRIKNEETPMAITVIHKAEHLRLIKRDLQKKERDKPEG